jgi:hypothetical protein
MTSKAHRDIAAILGAYDFAGLAIGGGRGLLLRTVPQGLSLSAVSKATREVSCGIESDLFQVNQLLMGRLSP